MTPLPSYVAHGVCPVPVLVHATRQTSKLDDVMERILSFLQRSRGPVEQRDAFQLRSDGKRYLFWANRDAKGRKQRSIARFSDDQVLSFHDAESFAALPADMQDGVRLYSDHVIDEELLAMLWQAKGPRWLAWKGPEGHQRIMVASTSFDRWTRRSPSLSDLSHLAFEPETATRFLRLAQGFDVFGTDAYRLPVDRPPSLGEFMPFKWHPRSSVLLTSIPDEAFTEQVVDHLMAVRGLRAINFLPARLITRERIEQALRSSDPDDPLGARRSVSLRLSKILPDHLELFSLNDLNRRYVLLKGAEEVESVIRIAHAEDNAPAGIDDMSIEEATQALLAHPVTRNDLAERFRDVPPVGRPWPMAVEALTLSLDGASEVVRSVLEGGWGEEEKNRIEELLAIPGMQRIVALETRPRLKVVATEGTSR